MKKLLVTLTLGAKALTLAAAVMFYAANADTASEDCFPCIPPPTCDPNCWDES